MLTVAKFRCFVSVAALAAGFALGDRPAQAANYGPLPILSANQASAYSTCYLEDENGTLVDLSAICDGGQGVLLPTMSVTNVKALSSQNDPPQRPRIKVTVIKVAPDGNSPQSETGCAANGNDTNCKPPVIEITGGKASEAIQELQGIPLSLSHDLGL